MLALGLRVVHLRQPQVQICPLPLLAMQVWASNLNFLNPFEKVFVLFVCLGLKFQSQAQGFSKQQLQKLILVLLFSEYRLGTMGSSSWGVSVLRAWKRRGTYKIRGPFLS